MEFRPTVYLSIAYTIANIALNFALSEAVRIAWWVKALSPNSTVKDLHLIWSFGSNIQDILLAGRSFNLVALAGLAVTLVPINGPLLQRASVLHEHTKVEYKNITIPVSQYFVPGYSGWITSRATSATSVSDDFGKIVNDYTARTDVNISNSGCYGTCTGRVLGAGYTIQCADDTVRYNITPPIETNRSIQQSTMFYTDFRFDELEGGNITFKTLFATNFSSFTGLVNRTNCTLRPATIDYPIKFVNDTITLDPTGSWTTDRVTKLQPGGSTGALVRQRSTHGGVALYFKSAYASGAEMWYDGVKGVQISINGSTIYGYMDHADKLGSTNGLGTSFLSPTSDIMAAVRQVAFRAAVQMPGLDVATYFNATGKVNQTAMDAWKAANTQQILVEQVRTEVIYKSQYVFLIIAVVLTFFATFAVLVCFNGWWHLGRNVSMSPIEIARAFAAPALIDSGSNVEVRTLLKQVGNKELRCGAAMEREDGDLGMASLRFDSAEKLARPQHGQMFGR